MNKTQKIIVTIYVLLCFACFITSFFITINNNNLTGSFVALVILDIIAWLILGIIALILYRTWGDKKY